MELSTEKKPKDRVLLPMSYDVEKLKADCKEIRKHGFEYYNVIPLRAPAHEVDASRPFPPPADDYADGSWTEWLNTSYLENAPYMAQIVKEFQEHTKVTLVRLLRLQAGATVAEHTDPTLGLEIHKSVVRLTIPIYTNDEVTFYLNQTPVPLQAGECWYLRLTDPHKIVNNSSEERINLTIDMIPNDWVRTLIEKSETN